MMRRLFFLSHLGAALLVLPLTARLWAEDNISSFTTQDLNTAISKSGLDKQRIYSIQSFIKDKSETDIAILSASRLGWRVTVLHRIRSGFELEWQSGTLPDDIAVSSSNQFTIESLDDGERVVQFSGCAAHACGGKDGVFGVLLYSPRAHRVFFAHYRFDKSVSLGSSGSLRFSENVEAHGDEKYKAALQKAVGKILGR